MTKRTDHLWRRSVNQFSARHPGESEAFEYICTICGTSQYVSPAEPLPAGPIHGEWVEE